MRIASKCEYANGDGLVVGIFKKAPKEAKTKADIIGVATVKKKGKKLLKSDVSYYTPDEAMCVAIGLLRAIDLVMDKQFKNFRVSKEK